MDAPLPSSPSSEPRVVRRIRGKAVTEQPAAEPLSSPADHQCMARITNDNAAQQFGNGRNKFYLEFRCPLPRFRDGNVCVRCLDKRPTGGQETRAFDHGLISDPIPPHSHLFGGPWYEDHVEKWGAPEQKIIAFALAHQHEARGPYYVPPSKGKTSLEKKDDPSSMPPRRTSATATATVPSEDPVIATETVKRRGKKAAVAASAAVAAALEEKEAPAPPLPLSKPKKRAAPRKKTAADATPYQALASEQRMLYKEVTLPTHLEETMEELDTAEYDVEYMHLTPITIAETVYFIHRPSQKVFKRIRDKQMGEYMGRYHPETETLHPEVPDSDDEEDEEEEDE